MATSSDNPVTDQILEQLKLLESRISRIEDRLEMEPAEHESRPNPEPTPRQEVAETSDSLEFHIGQFWLSQAGILALVVGIAFLLTFPHQHVSPFLPIMFGYGLVALMFGISVVMRNSFRHVARCLTGGALFLLYFATLRLYFFSPEPIVSNLNVELSLLAAAVLTGLIISVKSKSVFFTALSLCLGYATAIISGGSTVLFTGVLLMSALTVYLALRFNWGQLNLLGILLAYTCHTLWAMNNPLLGRPLDFVSSPRANLFFLLAFLVTFAAATLFRRERDRENGIAIMSSFLNVTGCYGLYLVLSIAEYRAEAASLHLLSSVVFLSLAFFFWQREQSRYSTFFYAMSGYASLTVAIIALAGQPEMFVWLCWQSLLVVATAVWFRSKFIVMANFFIFLGVFLAYTIMTEKVGFVSLSLGAVALISARILSWQQDRLQLKTELLRIIYLVSAFFIFPYALWHLMPRQYVSISWMVVALLYYVLSVSLKNTKYRWMALMTLLLTIVHLFVVGIVQLEPQYRIVSFIALGLILIAISLVYTRIRMRHER